MVPFKEHVQNKVRVWYSRTPTHSEATSRSKAIQEITRRSWGPKRSNHMNLVFWDLEFAKMRGTLFWGPYNKDPAISGTILGSSIFGNSHAEFQGSGFRADGFRV